jgi:hypothetical protein
MVNKVFNTLGVHQLNKLETITFDNNNSNNQYQERDNYAVRLLIELTNQKPSDNKNMFYQAPYDEKVLNTLRSNIFL